MLALIYTNWNSGCCWLGMFQQQRSRTDVHCSVICAITCPSQCRRKTRTDRSGTGLFMCAWAQVRDKQIWLTSQSRPRMWMCLPKASRDLLFWHRKWQIHEISKCWKLPLLQHHSGTGSAGSDMKWWAYTMGHLGIHRLSKAQRNLVTNY